MTPFLVALGEYGEREIVGKKNNPRVVEYHQSMEGWFDGDETPWCSAFVNWCHEQAGVVGTDRRNARSWLQWGVEADEPMLGDVVVFWRGEKDGQHGHVGFWVRKQENIIWVLGGNQSNKVCISDYPANRLLSVRRMV